MKNYCWNKCLIAVIVIFIFVAPVLFTRPALFGCFDFSSTGQIGDTIGGITAPIIGLVSIFLLYLTLKGQLDFNKSQTKDNRISQTLMLQSEIIHMDERIHFSYFIKNMSGLNEAYGCASLCLLYRGNGYNPEINLHQARCLLTHLVIFAYLCKNFKEKIRQEAETDVNHLNFVEEYLMMMKNFAEQFIDDNVPLVPAPADVYSEKNQQSEVDKIKECAKKILTIIS